MRPNDNVNRFSGKMLIEDLEEQIAKARREGGHPFLVAATAGTTVLGSFDPFDQIADVCEKNQLWFHVDVRLYNLFSFGFGFRLACDTLIQ